MGILSAIMPGLREFRVPLAGGIVWLCTLYVATLPLRDAWLAENTNLKRIHDDISDFPTVYVVALLLFSAYLLGASLSGVSRGLFRILKRSNRRDRRFFTDGSEARRLLRSALTDAYAEAGLHPWLASQFPMQLIEDRLEATAVQLQTKAPALHQECDRLRSEAEFRQTIALPLLVLGMTISVVLGYANYGWISPIFALVALVLVAQSRRMETQRRLLIINSIDQGLTKDSLSSAVIRQLRGIDDLDHPGASVEVGLAATALALWRIGELEGTERALKETASRIERTRIQAAASESSDFSVHSRAEEVRDLLRRYGGGELIARFNRLFDETVNPF